MKEMTKRFLSDAFAGESQAHMKYLIFAEEAAKKGLPRLANLFRAIAKAEYVHAKNHFVALGHLGSMEQNLQAGIDGESFEIAEMYPVYLEAAKLQGEKEAVRSNHFALEAEKITRPRKCTFAPFAVTPRKTESRTSARSAGCPDPNSSLSKPERAM
jgi:rubrerythrin